MQSKQPDDPGVDPLIVKDGVTQSWAQFFTVAWVLCILALLFFLSWSNTKALAHDWYPWECCAGNDCAPVSPLAVRESPQGYTFTITPGSHPMWPASKADPLIITVKHNKLKPSPDGEWHICIKATGELLCAWGVVGGM